MSKKKIMEEILQENRQANRNLIHLGNMTGLLLFMEGMKEAKKKKDKGAIFLAKFGLLIVAIIEIFLTAVNISELLEKRKEEMDSDRGPRFVSLVYRKKHTLSS